MALSTTLRYCHQILPFNGTVWLILLSVSISLSLSLSQSVCVFIYLCSSLSVCLSDDVNDGLESHLTQQFSIFVNTCFAANLESSLVVSSSSSSFLWKSAKILRSKGAQIHWPIRSLSSCVIPYSWTSTNTNS